jgi:integrase
MAGSWKKGGAMSAWIKQIASQVKKYGALNASWYCEWDEPDGSRRCKSCGSGRKGKTLAERLCQQIKAQILTGTYSRIDGTTWSDFRSRYEEKILSSLATATQIGVRISLDHFERHLALKGKTLEYISAERVRTFVAERKRDRGVKVGSFVSPATINRDLRHLRAVLNVAAEWEYLAACPKIRFEKEPKNLPRYVTPEHFATIYGACDVAAVPGELHVPAADWWRGLLVFAQMTGWRIGEILALEWADVDLAAGTAITRSGDNKGKRSEVVGLHPVVVDHLRPLKGFHESVFPWEHGRRQLYDEFGRIQVAAGIDLPCRATKKTAAQLDGEPRTKRAGHVCTPACHRYGFHDERRAFATMNAANMTREALQALMRHQSSLTTERYINYARQINPAVANLHVPDVLRLSGS